MRKFLLHIVLFCVAFLLAYLLGIRLVAESPLHGNISYVPANYGHMRSRIAEADTIGQVDVVFLGSSHCYRTFDPRIFAAEGIRIFNLGSSNQTPMQSFMLQERCLHSLQPRKVVIEVHPDIMASDGVESACDLLSNIPPCAEMRWMIGHLLRQPRVINTALYTCLFYDNQAEDSVICVGTNVNGEQVMCDFAYVRGGYVALPCHRYRPSPIEPQSIHINPNQLHALNACLRWLRSHGWKEVILVEVPSTQALYQSYINHSEFEETMSRVAKEMGAEYHNLNGCIPLVDSVHFFDEDHLNQEGAEIVSKYLIECVL